MMPRVSILRKLLVSLDISQHNALVIFTVKRGAISDISKKLLNDILAKCDRSSPIKNSTDTLNLGELRVNDILPKLTAESTKKNTPVR